MPERFNLTIDLGNDEMATPGAVADALVAAAEEITKTGSWEGAIKDLNGNTVGSYRLSDVPEAGDMLGADGLGADPHERRQLDEDEAAAAHEAELAGGGGDEQPF